MYHFLHLANSNSQVPPGEPGHDKLFKVRPFLDLILPTFVSEYIPYQAVTIDEAMIPFKRRLALKQYIKSTPTKWDIKVSLVMLQMVIYYVHKYTLENMQTVMHLLAYVHVLF